MASINKLSIRGVRAFSPEDEEQVISFCFPLTIIVGANGCGKTTIIESLKYAVTGGLPPGNKSGQAFVHDPKSMGQTSVKASIKLRFTNRAGNPMVVVRSMEVTQKRTTMSFKALDGIIRTTDPNTGQRVSLSHKCTELDRQIPTLMGVSKPILEHVVFCHQEDSSWPLQEGAILKKRFDDIFDSTRYAKALEAIRKLRLEYTGKVKDLKADQAGLSAHKKAAAGFREELETAKDAKEEIDDTIAGADDKIEVEEQAKAKHRKVLSEIEAIRLRRDEVEQQMEIAQATGNSLRQACDEDWTDKHTEEELQSMLSGFDEKIADDEKRLREANQAYRLIQTDIERFGDQKTRIHAELAKLAAERDQHEKDLRQRQRHMEEMGNKYALELDVSQTQSTYGGSTMGTFGTQQSMLSQGTTGGGRPSLDTVGTGRASIGGMTGLSQETLVTISNDDMSAFQNAVTKKRAELAEEKDERHKEATEQQDDLVKKLSDLNARMNTISSEKDKLKAKTNEALKELQRLKTTSAVGKVHKSDIEDAKRLAAKAQLDADNANKDPRMNVIPQEIAAHETKISQLKMEIEDDQRTVTDLRKNEDELREMNMLKRQVENEREVIIEGLKDESSVLYKYQVTTDIGDGNEDDENHILRMMEDKANAVNEKYLLTKDTLSRATDTRNSIQQRVSEKSALQSHNTRQLTNLRNQSAVLNAPNRGVKRIENVLREVQKYEVDNGFSNTVISREPQQLIQHLTDRLSECQDEKDSPDTITRTIKKLKKLARKTNPDGTISIICPCCDRGMTCDEAKVFQDTMVALADPVNSEIIKTDQARSKHIREAVQHFTQWRDEVSQSVTDYLDYKRISSEIAALEGPVQSNEDDLKRLERELKEAKEEVDTQTQEVGELRTLLEQMNRLRDEASKIARKKVQIREKGISVGTNVASDKDLETVEKNLARRSKEKEDLMTAIGDLNKESADLNARAKAAFDKAATLEKTAKEKEDRYNEEQKSSVRRNELNDLINTSRDEEKKLDSEIEPIRRQISAKQTDINRLRQSNKVEGDRLNENLNQFTRDAQRLDDLNSKIDKYLYSNKQEAFDRLNDDLAEHEGKIAEKKKALKDMSPELSALKKKLDDQARHKKNLENNIKVFDEMAKEKRYAAEIEKISEELDLIEGSDSSQQEYNRACAKIRQYEDERNEAKGRRGGIKDQIKLLRRKLNTEDYKDIDERHRQCMIRVGTTEECVNDLGKYYKALDNALLRYHGMKIADINKIIRELWSLTYKGEDITNIQLVSGAEGATKAARSYNYRVVMTKGNSQLDMRGRCSAGQRVLASIVIRLALAETFCLNCGVMALDEPTTNLDYANKRGLAIALAQIIASRAIQSNFQLVIITHDEDFVSMMKNELSSHTGFNMPERYFQVAREESSDGKFYSKISAIDWDEI